MKINLILILLCIAKFALSQNITFDEAQSLRKKSLAEVETYLVEKGWSMTDAQEASSEKMGKAIFGFEVDMFDSEKATAWITFYVSDISNNFNRLSIQIHKSKLYSTFLTRLKANAYKLSTSKIENGAIEKVYKNSTTTCVVTTSTSEGTYTKRSTYSFFFIDNLSYKLNFENDE